MANQIIVESGTSNITVTTSRSVIGTIADVASSNYANFAGNIINANQPNITNIGTLTNLNVNQLATIGNLVVTGNIQAGFLVANNANYSNFAGTVLTNAQPNITSVGILNGLVVEGDIVPNANITYNLGNNTNRFNDLYLSNSTIYLGNQQISANATSVNFSGNINAGNINGNVTGNIIGNVANANYAAFSGVAYSVSGSNVSGQVANANYSNFSNVANSANSVAVGNVVGIGNIATVNLDGNGSNVLLGNGVFGNAPSSTPTTIANGTSNINIAAANGNIAVSVNNNSNLVVFESNVLMNASPLSTQTNALRINSIGNPQSDAHRIAWFRSRGTVASPLSVQPNDAVFSILSVAHNGTTYNTSYITRIQGLVDSTYTANTANVPMGLRFQVAQTTQSGPSNTTITHNFWSNGNVTFAQTVNAGNFAGDGTSLSNITGANVTGTVANANYATNAGIATSANSVAVANVTGIGNIATLNLDGNSNTVLYGNGIFAELAIISNVANANYANFAGTAYSVDGANVSGSVANANYSNFAGEVTSSAQPNITSVGNLTTLVVTGDISGANVSTTGALTGFDASVTDLYVTGIASLSDPSNVIITGGNSGEYLSTDGNGVLSWSAVDLTTISNGNSNVSTYSDEVVTISSNGQANIISVTSNGSHAQTTIENDVTVTGNISVAGNLIYNSVTSLSVTDPIIALGTGPNGEPLVNNDGLDRGTALHTYGTGGTYTTVGTTSSGSNVIALTDITGIQVGQQIAFTNHFNSGTTISNIYVGNTSIEISQPTIKNIPDNSNVSIGLDIIRFIGWDVSDNRFVIASNTTISNNIATYNSYGNVKLGGLIIDNLYPTTGNIIANAVLTTNSNGQVSYSSLDRGTY